MPQPERIFVYSNVARGTYEVAGDRDTRPSPECGCGCPACRSDALVPPSVVTNTARHARQSRHLIPPPLFPK